MREFKRKINNSKWKETVEKIEKSPLINDGNDFLNKQGPKQLFKMGLFESEFLGYRPGFTKPTLKDRVEKNRKQEKARRKANKRNRNK